MTTMPGRGGARATEPAWVEVVEGVRLPRRVAGHPGLELCNTLANCGEPGSGSDYLADVEALGAWTAREGLLDHALARATREAASADPMAATRELERVRAFRVSLWRTLVDPTPADQLVVAEQVEEAAGVPKLELEPAARFTFPADLGIRLPRLAAVWSAAGLLVSPERERVRRCAGLDCGWLFLDTSGRRRWCLMASCGNRAKARRFAQRRFGTAS
jgi:predicted RNA-binding Zn ribbon-like protein